MRQVIESLALLGAGGYPASGVDFTALDIRTTGLRPGHLIELAAVRVRADGVVVGELATLIDPGRGISPGASGHGITRSDLDGAPAFGAVLGPLLDLCGGSILVAHDLPFVAGFLTAELARLGVRVPIQPGVCTLTAAQRAVRLPNYRLSTVAHVFGVMDRPTPQALSGARTIARLVTALFSTHGFTFADPPSFPVLPRYAGADRLRARPVDVVEPGWMAGVVERVPISLLGTDPAAGQAYLDLLADVVADQHLSTDEVWALAALAAEAGLAGSDVRGMHERFVRALRQVAEGDGVVTPEEERDLRQVARALDVVHVVADLRPTGAGNRPMRVLVLGTTLASDRLRARVLDEGVQLAKKLTATVTHLVCDRTIAATEPRLARAGELGAAILDVEAAPVGLGFEAAPAERTAILTPVSPPPAMAHPVPQPSPATAPNQRVKMLAGRILMGIGLFLMFVTVIAMFTGSGVGGGIVGAIFGLGFLLGGWWLTEDGRGTPAQPKQWSDARGM